VSPKQREAKIAAVFLSHGVEGRIKHEADVNARVAGESELRADRRK
jgi:hypothetical protein